MTLLTGLQAAPELSTQRVPNHDPLPLLPAGPHCLGAWRQLSLPKYHTCSCRSPGVVERARPRSKFAAELAFVGLASRCETLCCEIASQAGFPNQPDKGKSHGATWCAGARRKGLQDLLELHDSLRSPLDATKHFAVMR